MAVAFYELIVLLIVLAPPVGYLAERLVRSRPRIDRSLLFCAATIMGVVGGALSLDLRFVNYPINLITFVSLVHAVSFVIWHVTSIPIRILLTFGVAFYLLFSAIGFLGIAIGASSEFPYRTLRLTEDLTLREYALGNALSDFRGFRVEVGERISGFRFIERKVVDTSYFSIVPYGGDVSISFDEDSGRLTMTAERHGERWREVLTVQ